MSDKAIISTIHLDYLLSNYGSFWQHWCLRRYLKDKGFSVSRYAGVDGEFKYGKWLKSRILDFLRAYIVWPLKRIPNRKSLSKNLLDEHRRTSGFIKEYRRLIGPLKENQEPCDDAVLVMGSDQNLNEFEKNWFSIFPDSARRIMYAGSTDWKSQANNEKWLAIASSELPRFTAVSAREEAGLGICQQYSKVPVAHVVDPVMLVDPAVLKSQSCTRTMFKRDTLLCYMVNIRQAEDLHLEKLIAVAEKLGCDLKIIGLQGAAGFVPEEYTVIPSPTQFLGMIRDAKYMITNSFHGAVFALLYEKPFVCLRQVCEAGCDQNTRQCELMEWTGLSKWVMPSCADVDILTERLRTPFYYDVVRSAIESRRQSSRSWLEKALQ